ncbi:conserved hypothetical protein (DUF4270) [Formosa agariphila KMM 3901]|uniref:Lipoprotein n=1 Tax=Formosa agariphila (strain DSM 15362 / KCTC 12365 / LMG 23005 / KMM 3901 / M-2Alg 35-1) TaxID=1347342 RepID=T2KS92_FORAG|nr:DUF4270 domain-containing protein [Formosa agariphila]CDF81034.1 conserved hypothetical protein (DUF4270) [Formosa agariphila KMM 3901]
MKKILQVIKLSSILLVILTVLIACDKDYNSIGTDIVGNKDFITDSIEYPIIAYSKKVKPVQTNGLSSNLLGAYNDPDYGITTASVVSQMYPNTYSPYFGINPEIESITLTLPYYSTAVEVDDEGGTTYKLDSLYGTAPIKLSIYQNTYYLRSTDPSSDFNESQLYYSNANETINFDNFKGELLYSNTSFFPSNEEIVIEEYDEDTEEDVVTSRLSPRLQVDLLNTNNFWEKLIFDKEDSPELSNQNNFVNYFRGIYIKAETVDNDGNQILINFDSGDAEIAIKYNYTTESDTDAEIFEGEYTLKFNTTRINLFESDINFSDGNALTGDTNLYLKGGEGSMAVIDLFHGPDEDGDGEADSYLDEFLAQKDKWLINEAQLIVYEDESQINTANDNHTYDRLYAYDVNNNLTLIDYSFDQTTNTGDPLYSKISHLGQRLDTDGNYKYKIRITEHVKNILTKDSTNTKIGLVLSTNVNNTLTADLLGSEGEEVTGLPEGAILSPKGTVLHGSNSNVPENLRAKLKIYYTEPEN